MSLDEIRIAILALHGALSAADSGGDYAEPLVHLLTAVHLLGGANHEMAPSDVDPDMPLAQLFQRLTLLELELRDLLLTSPSPPVKGMVALPSLSLAVNSAIAGYARRRRQGRA